jgi:hypothetical protein
MTGIFKSSCAGNSAINFGPARRRHIQRANGKAATVSAWPGRHLIFGFKPVNPAPAKGGQLSPDRAGQACHFLPEGEVNPV